MDNAKKLDFIHKMSKLGLQHFDDGGTVLGGSPAIVSNTPNTNMSTIGNALGLNNGFLAGSANIQGGTNLAQLNNAYTGATSALNNQSNLTNTLQPQAQAGVEEQSQLAAQLRAQENGTGPNVAQNQLNQATAANVANQAALMAGGRGANANAGLIAREAAQQGATIQQQAAGQAATLGAQQQIAAQQQLAGLAQNQINQAGGAVNAGVSGQQGEQGILQNANTAFNNAGVGMQSNINDVNSKVAAGNAATNAGIFGSLTNSLGGVGSFLSNLGGSSGASSGAQTIAGGPGDAVNSLDTMFAAKGGTVKKMAEGGAVDSDGSNLGHYSAARSPVHKGYLHHLSCGGGIYAQGGPVKMTLASKGGPVNADNKKEKAVVNKDSYANDKVPALLSEGELVIDKDTMNDPGPLGQMARALAKHINAKNKAKK